VPEAAFLALRRTRLFTGRFSAPRNNTVTKLCLQRGRVYTELAGNHQEEGAVIQVTDSDPTLAMDKITSVPETLFPPPDRVARRSFIRSLRLCAAAILLVFPAGGQMAQTADPSNTEFALYDRGAP
jgi:hypothetical protein